MSSSEDHLKHTLSRVLLNAFPNVTLGRTLGKLTPFRFWLNSKLKEMLSRPLGKLTRSRAKESTWKADSFQRLVE